MRNIASLVVIALLLTGSALSAQTAEKQLVMTITSEQLNGGLVSEITWDGGALVLQGAFAKPSGELSAKYFVQPARGVAMEQREGHTEASARYWEIEVEAAQSHRHRADYDRRRMRSCRCTASPARSNG